MKVSARRFFIFFFVLSAVFLFGPWFARGASAATLYLSPHADTEYVGQSFTVTVYVSSADTAMNAAQGTISFPIDKLSVVSISRAGSVMNLWVQDPSFSNKDGVVNFQGVAVNPGFMGAAGKVISITFTAKQTGTAPLIFSSSAVLANDGKGTNILTGTSGSTFSISTPPAGTPTPPPVSTQPTSGSGTPGAAPIITSDPPTDNTSWYNLSSIVFGWNVASDVKGISYALATTTNYDLPQTSGDKSAEALYDLTTLPDGVWYFNLSIEHGSTWSLKGTKTLRLDRAMPDPFTITRVDKDLTSDEPSFNWTTADRGSGIAYFAAKIGDGDWFRAADIKQASAYVLPSQKPTDAKTLTVRAFDNAGNYQTSEIVFRVISPNSWQAFVYELSQFVSQFGWILGIIALILAFGAYLFIYNFILWRRKLRKELGGLTTELRHDLGRLQEELESVKRGSEIDLRPSSMEKKKHLLERETKEIEKDISEELKKLNKL